MKDLDLESLSMLIAEMTPGPYETGVGGRPYTNLISRDPNALAAQLADEIRTSFDTRPERDSRPLDVETVEGLCAQYLGWYKCGALVAESLSEKDGVAIAALLNAAPLLIAAVKEARSSMESLRVEVKAETDKGRAYAKLGRSGMAFLRDENARLAADNERLRTQLSLKAQAFAKERDEHGATLNRLQTEQGSGFRRGMVRAAEIVQKHAPAGAVIIDDESESQFGSMERLHSLIVNAANDPGSDNADAPDLVRTVEAMEFFDAYIAWRRAQSPMSEAIWAASVNWTRVVDAVVRKYVYPTSAPAPSETSPINVDAVEEQPRLDSERHGYVDGTDVPVWVAEAGASEKGCS